MKSTRVQISGFTLIELLVVIAIIGLLSTLAIVALGSARQKSRDARRVSDLRQIQTSLEMYNSEKGAYPTSTFVIGDLAHACLNIDGFQAAGCSNPYLAKLPKDPGNNFYIYSWSDNGYTVAATLEGSVGELFGKIGVSSNSGIAPANSLGINLVTNGFGYANNNYNFPGFTFDTSDTYFGNGSFRDAAVSSSRRTDELIPVDGNKNYRLSMWAKSTTYAAGSRAYLGVAPFDADGLFILPQYYRRIAGTDTTLAQALNPGDTVVHLTSGINWVSSGIEAYERQIVIFNYTNSLGYTYPPYTYSRNSSINYGSYYTNGAWAVGGISGNDINLTAPWPASLGAVPAGTPVSNGYGNYSNKYIALSNGNIPPVWTNYAGTIGGWDVTGGGGALFPNGTEYIKVMFLLNREVPGNVTNISDVQFYETD